MQQLLHPVCAALAVAGFLLLLCPPRHLRQDRALAALVGVYGFCALSFLVSLAPVWKTLGDTTGLPAAASSPRSRPSWPRCPSSPSPSPTGCCPRRRRARGAARAWRRGPWSSRR
ncbi:hypothetical protein ACFQ2B_33065 [Streptomyces stramineus]